jgi:hypothetical protein
MSNGGDLSRVVVESVAAVEGTDATALRPPLAAVVDPEALSRVCAGDESVAVRFEYRGHHVCVRGDGLVRVDDHAFERSEGGALRRVDARVGAGERSSPPPSSPSSSGSAPDDVSPNR